MLMVRTLYATNLSDLASMINELNGQAEERHLSSWRLVSVVRDDDSDDAGGRPWCAFLEAERKAE